MSLTISTWSGCPSPADELVRSSHVVFASSCSGGCNAFACVCCVAASMVWECAFGFTKIEMFSDDCSSGGFSSNVLSGEMAGGISYLMECAVEKSVVGSLCMGSSSYS